VSNTLPTGEPGYPTVPADELRPHQAVLRMPPLSDDEFTALVADIRQNGVRYPVLVDEDGYILDGIHR
jgi:ParB-like chromosome segregation protein Spo0J